MTRLDIQFFAEPLEETEIETEIDELDDLEEYEEDVDEVDNDDVDDEVEAEVNEVKKTKVIYNQKEYELTEDEAKPLIQKGMNYDKVAEKAKKADELQKELERQKQINENYRKTFGEYGNDDDEITLTYEALSKGVDVEELKAQKEVENTTLRTMLKKDPIYQLGVKARLEAIKQADLMAIKTAFPFVKAMTIEEIPNFVEFASLMDKTDGKISAVDAFKYTSNIKTKVDTGKEDMTTINGSKTSKTDYVEIPKDTLKFLRETFPNDSLDSLKKKYQQIK